MRAPPALVRRGVLAPLILGAEAALVLASPVLGLLAALASPLTGGRRPLRLVAAAVVYASEHLRATAACLRLDPGDQTGHYAVMERFVAALERVLVQAARVRLVAHESEAAHAALSSRDRPLIVLSMHAGEGDSLLVIHELLCRHGRRPRIVMHGALRLDPLIDLLGTRLPNRFVDPRGGDTEVEIAAMTRGLPGDAAVLVFPEGANATPERRRRSVERLTRAGHHEEAGWADELRHLLAPRPGGALAALEAAPDADVVFVGHAGFPSGAADVWRRLPELQTIEMQLWLVPAADVPEGRDARIDWLFAWWRVLDDWVEAAGG